jgi:hypothetical protein
MKPIYAILCLDQGVLSVVGCTDDGVAANEYCKTRSKDGTIFKPVRTRWVGTRESDDEKRT